ncbi:unnamed protein product [Brassicogethes aeneus]|uniref:C-CAP/cofactor C-like domain-containing protein n=1 Tax=Brassicogethes aeneus TaxID=1431903 RepID=A0A9P0B0N5_BRAAE|nr:unnamed protein product [Brassicogethes aeneus]
MSIFVYGEILQLPLTKFLNISEKIGGDVKEQSILVKNAFQAQLQYLEIVSKNPPPRNEHELMISLKPTSDSICEVQEFRGKNRTSQFFNHLSAISESIPALGWVIVTPAPAPFVQYMNDSGQFYSNRVLNDWKGKDKKHIEWVNSWVETLSELQVFVKRFHANGLIWDFKHITTGDSNDESVQARRSFVKPANFIRDGKKWIIEHQRGNQDLIIDSAQLNNVVYMYDCKDSFLTVKGKINSIVLDSCKKTSVVFDSLLSTVEFINCESVQMQVFGRVPTITIDKTDGCQIYLSQESLDVEIITAKSTEMNIMVPDKSGDYIENPIAEQFKTTILPNLKLSTVTADSSF